MILNLSDRHRLAILAVAITDYPDSADDVLELAAGVEALVELMLATIADPPANLADLGRRIHDAELEVNRRLSAALLEAAPESKLGELRTRVIRSLQEV